MSNKQKGFIVYKEFKAVLDRLSDEEAGKLIKGMVDYFADGKEPKFEGVLEFVFIPVKQQMDRDAEKYDERCEKNKKNISEYWSKVKSDTNEYNRKRMNTIATNTKTNTKTNTNTNTKTTTNTKDVVVVDKKKDLGIWTNMNSDDVDRIYDAYPNSGGFLIDAVNEEVKLKQKKVKDPVAYILGYAKNVGWDDDAEHEVRWR